MKILTWNIYMLPLLVPRGGKKRRAKGIAEELSKEHFDIIVFEEAFLPASRDIIWQRLHEVYPFQYGPVNNTPHIKSSSGVWVLSRTKLEVLHTIQFNENAGWDSLVRKGAMLLEGNWKGQPFQILGTHLQAGEKQKVLRNTQLEQLKKELLQPYSRTGVPQFICADMNISSKRADEYQHMLQYLQAEDGPISGTEKLSYDGEKNIIARLLGVHRKLNYDYILIRDNGHRFASLNRRISILKQGRRYLSDHYGVVLDVEF